MNTSDSESDSDDAKKPPTVNLLVQMINYAKSLSGYSSADRIKYMKSFEDQTRIVLAKSQKLVNAWAVEDELFGYRTDPNDETVQSETDVDYSDLDANHIRLKEYVNRDGGVNARKALLAVIYIFGPSIAKQVTAILKATGYGIGGKSSLSSRIHSAFFNSKKSGLIIFIDDSYCFSNSESRDKFAKEEGLL